MSDERLAAYSLLETGASVAFTVVDERVEPSPGGDATNVRVELTLGDAECDTDVEWGALGFMFTLAVLSFADARPRGVSDMDYLERDEFGLVDFLPAVRFERGRLAYHADYIRGRSVKTSITVTADGRVTLETAGRGEAPLHWIRRLRGEKRLRGLPSRSAPAGVGPG